MKNILGAPTNDPRDELLGVGATDYEKQLMKKNIELNRLIRKQHKRVDIFFYGVMTGVTFHYLFMTYAYLIYP